MHFYRNWSYQGRTICLAATILLPAACLPAGRPATSAPPNGMVHAQMLLYLVSLHVRMIAASTPAASPAPAARDAFCRCRAALLVSANSCSDLGAVHIVIVQPGHAEACLEHRPGWIQHLTLCLLPGDAASAGACAWQPQPRHTPGPRAGDARAMLPRAVPGPERLLHGCGRGQLGRPGLGCGWPPHEGHGRGLGFGLVHCVSARKGRGGARRCVMSGGSALQHSGYSRQAETSGWPLPTTHHCCRSPSVR